MWWNTDSEAFSLVYKLPVSFIFDKKRHAYILNQYICLHRQCKALDDIVGGIYASSVQSFIYVPQTVIEYGSLGPAKTLVNCYQYCTRIRAALQNYFLY